VHAYRSGPPPTRAAIAARTHPGAKHKSNLDGYLVTDFEAFVARDYATMSEPVSGRAAVAAAVLSGHFLDWSRSPSEADRAAAKGFRITRVAADALAGSLCAGGPPITDVDLRARLAQAMLATGYGVYQAASDRRFIDTASSCTLAVFQQGRLEVVQAGETRGYLFREGRLAWVSQGASPDGLFAPNPSRPPPLGVASSALPPLYSFEMRAGDTVVLCSRGIGSTLDERRLHGILASSPSLDAAAKAVMDQALAVKSEHNLTVVLAALLP
jgi:protein phosphatase